MEIKRNHSEWRKPCGIEQKSKESFLYYKNPRPIKDAVRSEVENWSLEFNRAIAFVTMEEERKGPKRKKNPK